MDNADRYALLRFIYPIYDEIDGNTENHLYDVIVADESSWWYLVDRDQVTLEKVCWWHPNCASYDRSRLRSNNKPVTPTQLARLDEFILDCATSIVDEMNQLITRSTAD